MKSFDQIGPNLHLIDYEQLKVENQSHVDKIEEREDELLKLRTKCSGAIQCLAHVREKSAALEVDIISLRDTLEDVQMDYTDASQNSSPALLFNVRCLLGKRTLELLQARTRLPQDLHYKTDSRSRSFGKTAAFEAHGKGDERSGLGKGKVTDAKRGK